MHDPLCSAAIRQHLSRGDLSDGLVFDAIRIRLLEIGEAVKAISPSLLASEPGIPWKNIASMRDQLAHRYFDTNHAIVSGTVTNDLTPLHDASNSPAADSADSPGCGMAATVGQGGAPMACGALRKKGRGGTRASHLKDRLDICSTRPMTGSPLPSCIQQPGAAPTSTRRQ